MPVLQQSPDPAAGAGGSPQQGRPKRGRGAAPPSLGSMTEDGIWRVEEMEAAGSPQTLWLARESRVSSPCFQERQYAEKRARGTGWWLEPRARSGTGVVGGWMLGSGHGVSPFRPRPWSPLFSPPPKIHVPTWAKLVFLHLFLASGRAEPEILIQQFGASERKQRCK